MTSSLIAPPEGTFWKLEGPQDDLTLALIRKRDYAALAHRKVARGSGNGFIRSDIRVAQSELLSARSDLLALQEIRSEFLGQEASA